MKKKSVAKKIAIKKEMPIKAEVAMSPFMAAKQKMMEKPVSQKDAMLKIGKKALKKC